MAALEILVVKTTTTLNTDGTSQLLPEHHYPFLPRGLSYSQYSLEGEQGIEPSFTGAQTSPYHSDSLMFP